jgi:hypothetical protein
MSVQFSGNKLPTDSLEWPSAMQQSRMIITYGIPTKALRFSLEAVRLNRKINLALLERQLEIPQPRRPI